MDPLLDFTWEDHVYVARSRSFHAIDLGDRCLWIEHSGTSGEEINLLALIAEGHVRQKGRFVERLLCSAGKAFHTSVIGGEPPNWISTLRALKATVQRGMLHLLLEADSEFCECLAEWHLELFEEVKEQSEEEESDEDEIKNEEISRRSIAEKYLARVLRLIH